MLLGEMGDTRRESAIHVQGLVFTGLCSYLPCVNQPEGTELLAL